MDMGVSESFIRPLGNKTIQYLPRKRQKSQFEVQEEKLGCKTFEYSSIFFNGTSLWFFPNKKIFFQDQKMNSQNNSWLSLSPQNVTILIKTSQSTSWCLGWTIVMVTLCPIYLKRSLMVSTTASKWLWNLLQIRPTVSLFKLVNTAVILALSKSLVWHGVLLVYHTQARATHNQGDCNLGN